MKKEDFLLWLKDIEGSIGLWKVVVDKEVFSNFVVGCFYDEKLGVWKVYMNEDMNSHDIFFESDNEEIAFSKLKSMVEFVIDNSRGYY